MHIHHRIDQAGFILPVSRSFTQLMFNVLSTAPDMPSSTQAVTLNFRDPQYSSERGGYHPVEIRLIRLNEGWRFDYVTDFGFVGTVYPELEKILDFSWTQRYVFESQMGDLTDAEGRELFTLWQQNFVSYWHADAYTTTVSWEI